ncbi:MAG: PaaI family thioesterase, partial [Candidatus Promineifilaceae bacterium]
MQIRNPDYQAFVREIFRSAPYIRSLGIELVDFGVGWVETVLVIRPNHHQQHGFVHAGVQATLADHSAGAAAATLNAPNVNVLTIEFKLNLL